MPTENEKWEFLKDFLMLYRGICDFSIDQSLLPREKIVKPRPSHVNPDEFFNELYVPRSQEQVITESLLYSPNMVLLIGERGSGKTTLAYKIKREFSKNKKSLVFYIDVRKGDVFSKPLDQIKPEEISSEILNVIRKKYFTYVFYEEQPTKLANNENYAPIIKLAAYLIDSQKRKPDGYELGLQVQWLQRKYRKYLRSFGKNISILDWLSLKWDTDDEIYERIYSILDGSMVKPSLLMHAAHAIFGFERQCIWIDNVDVASPKQQARFQRAFKGLSSSISEFANLVISVREENVFREDEFNEIQAPPRTFKVKLYVTGDIREREAEAIEINQIPWKDFKLIANKRLDFAKKRMEDLNQRSFDKITYDKFRLASNFVIDNVWRNVHLTKLSNNSIRFLLNHHYSFMSYLHETQFNSGLFAGNSLVLDRRHKKGKLLQRQLITSYYSWIRNITATKYQMEALDVVKVAMGVNQEIRFNYFDHIDKDLLAQLFLPHMILASIWNMTFRNIRKSGYISYIRPRVGSLVALFDKLDIEEKTVKQQLFHIYSTLEDDDTPRLIEILNPDEPTYITNYNQIQNNYLLIVTPRAKAILRYILNTYGFIAESKMSYLNEKKDYQESQKHQVNFDIANLSDWDAWQFIKEELIVIGKLFLCKLVFLDEYYRGRNWVNDCLLDFGIPIPAKWDNDIGVFIDSHRRATQYEIMLTGLRIFFRDEKVKFEINNVLGIFLNAMREVQLHNLSCNDILMANFLRGKNE